MTAVKVTVRMLNRNAAVSGPSRVIVPALKLIRCPRHFDDRNRWWVIPTAHVDDLLAALDHRFGAEVDLIEATA